MEKKTEQIEKTESRGLGITLYPKPGCAIRLGEDGIYIMENNEIKAMIDHKYVEVVAFPLKEKIKLTVEPDCNISFPFHKELGGDTLVKDPMSCFNCEYGDESSNTKTYYEFCMQCCDLSHWKKLIE